MRRWNEGTYTLFCAGSIRAALECAILTGNNVHVLFENL